MEIQKYLYIIYVEGMPFPLKKVHFELRDAEHAVHNFLRMYHHNYGQLNPKAPKIEIVRYTTTIQCRGYNHEN